MVTSLETESTRETVVHKKSTEHLNLVHKERTEHLNLVPKENTEPLNLVHEERTEHSYLHEEAQEIEFQQGVIFSRVPRNTDIKS